MSRRSDYPFHKSDTKFGTNLIASLFSIPISLGVAAIFDGIRGGSKYNSGKLSSEEERIACILGAIVIATLLFLGIYLVSSSEEYSILNFIGTVLLFFSVPSFVIGIILLIVYLRDKRIALKTREGYVWETIDETLENLLYQSLNVELYFHFTRPCLTKEEYQNIKSPRLHKKIETYDDYYRAWSLYHWYYSFQMKFHNAITEVLSAAGFLLMSEPEYYKLIRQHLLPKLNTCEKEIFLNEMQGDVENCCSCGFDINAIRASVYNEEDIVRKLNVDLKNRKELILKKIYKQYGGTWNPELLNQLDVWRHK